MRQRRLPEAMKVLEAGLKLSADDPVLLNNTGMCWLIRKRYQNALDYFTKASAIVPENTRYRSNMATALALMGRYVNLLNLRTGDARRVGARSDAGLSIAFSPRDDRLLTANREELASLWSVKRKRVTSFRGHAGKAKADKSKKK